MPRGTCRRYRGIAQSIRHCGDVGGSGEGVSTSLRPHAPGHAASALAELSSTCIGSCSCWPHLLLTGRASYVGLMRGLKVHSRRSSGRSAADSDAPPTAPPPPHSSPRCNRNRGSLPGPNRGLPEEGEPNRGRPISRPLREVGSALCDLARAADPLAGVLALAVASTSPIPVPKPTLPYARPPAAVNPAPSSASSYAYTMSRCCACARSLASVVAWYRRSCTDEEDAEGGADNPPSPGSAGGPIAERPAPPRLGALPDRAALTLRRPRDNCLDTGFITGANVQPSTSLSAASAASRACSSSLCRAHALARSATREPNSTQTNQGHWCLSAPTQNASRQIHVSELTLKRD